jgi:hypothetical protein
MEAIDLANVTIEVSPIVSNPGEEVTFFVNASSDIPSATITVLIRFDDRLSPSFANNTASPTALNVTGSPARVVQKYTYDHIGNFTEPPPSNRSYFYVRVFVQDNASTTVTPPRIRYFVNNNTAPTIGDDTTPNLQPKSGIPANITLEIADADNDVLNVSWDFGDGTSLVDVVTATYFGAYSNQTHTWNVTRTPGIGDYWHNTTVNITIDDGQGHWANWTIPVNIYIPPNRGPVPDPVWGLVPSVKETDPADPITFYASARDLEGDGIYWYFDFGDGTKFNDYTGPSVANITVWYNQTHLYASSGANRTSYNATLWVSDGAADHNATTGFVEVFVVLNFPPEVGNIEHLQTMELNITTGYLNITFYVDVINWEPDNVTVVWSMGDGSPLRFNSTNSTGKRTFYQWRNFTEPTYFNITVNVTDGREGHEVFRYLDTVLRSNNQPPMLTQAPAFNLSFGDAARPNETLNITLKVSDAEFDNLTVVWDFGDNSPILVFHFNRTDYVGPNVTCSVTHAYAKNGTYRIRIWITDNEMLGADQHNVTVNATVTVKEAFIPVVTVWDWWDYTSLGLFLMIPVSIAVYSLLIFRRRRRLDKEGVNWDEYRTKRDSGIEEEL